LSDLYQNPFFLLGATTRDDRRHIVELADEKALLLDHELCQKARTDLIGLRARLAAEMSWLPGVSPKEALQLVDQLLNNPMFIRMASGLPSLAHANLMAAAINVVAAKEYPENPEDLSRFIKEMAYLVDDITVDDIIRDINEDRLIAGFPLILAKDLVEQELIDRKRYYQKSIKEALNRHTPKSLILAITLAVDSTTASGKDQAPQLIDEIVDSYELESQYFLQKEAENASIVIKRISDYATSDQALIKPLIDKLDKVIANWFTVAYPIQMSMNSRGLVHNQSRDLGFEIRELAIYLFNEHKAINEAKQIIDLLRNYFSQCAAVAVYVEDDENVLAGIANKRKFDKLISPIYELCNEALSVSGRNPQYAYIQGQNIIAKVPELLKAAKLMGAPLEVINESKDHIAATLTTCAVKFGNKTSKWKSCLDLLHSAHIFAIDPQIKERVSHNLEIVRNNIILYGNTEPMSSTPPLYTINGCGLTLYGSTDTDLTNGSYMATYYFVLFFVPIFPICRYRVISSGGRSYRFLGKGALRTIDKWHISISVLVMIILIITNIRY